MHANITEVLPDWIPGEQQDAHEFLLGLLDRMDTELQTQCEAL